MNIDYRKVKERNMTKFFYRAGILTIIAYIVVWFYLDVGIESGLLGIILFGPIPMLMIGMGEVLERLDVISGRKLDKGRNVPDSLFEKIEYKHDGKWKCFNCNRKNSLNVEVCECGRKREEN